MNIPFVIVDGVPVLAGIEDGQLVGLAIPGGQLASFEADEVTGFVSIDPAAVYFGSSIQFVREQGMPIAAAPKKRAGKFQPRGHLFQPLPDGMVSGYPLARPALDHFRAEIPSEDVVRLSALFAISTIRVRIEMAEASFECFAEFYEKARGRGVFPAIDEIRSCFGQLKNTKARQFSEVSEYAPTIRKAMLEGLRDRALRRYLAMETVLPEGLGLAKLSFTLLLLGQDCMCLDTRILSRMFGSWAKGEQIQTGWPKDPKGHISELGLRRYESVEESFLAGNQFYDPKDPIGRGRAQWLSWEPLGHPPAPATHSVWLRVVTQKTPALPQGAPRLTVVRAGNGATTEDVIRRLQKRDHTRASAEQLVAKYHHLIVEHPGESAAQIADRIGTAADCDQGLHTHQCPHGDVREDAEAEASRRWPGPEPEEWQWDQEEVEHNVELPTPDAEGFVTLFHGTLRSHLSNIRRQGLKPGTHRGGRAPVWSPYTFLAVQYREAAFWSRAENTPDTVVLQVRLPASEVFRDSDTGYWVTRNDIPTSNIKIARPPVAAESPTVAEVPAEAGSRDWQSIWKKNRLPSAPGPILDARWVAGLDDWYVLTDTGWYWLRGQVWVKVPNGPLGEKSGHPSSKLAYHVTSAARLPHIEQSGLIPGAMPEHDDRYSEFDDGKHIFFYDDLARASSWPGYVVLRFPWPSDAKQDVNVYGRALPGQFVSASGVSPEQIAIQMSDDSWSPIANASSIASEAGRQEGAYRGWQHRRERDEFVQQNLPPELLPLWSRIGSSFSGSPEERYADFMQYVHDHPDEDMQASKDESSAKVQRLIQQRMAGAPVARAQQWSLIYRGVHFDVTETLGQFFAVIGSEVRTGNHGQFGTQDEAVAWAHTRIDEMLGKSVPVPSNLRPAGSQIEEGIVQLMDYLKSGAIPMRPDVPAVQKSLNNALNKTRDRNWPDASASLYAANKLVDDAKFNSDANVLLVLLGQLIDKDQNPNDPEPGSPGDDRPHDLPARPKPPEKVTLQQLAAAFLSDIENPRQTYWKDYMGDDRVPKIVAALKTLKIKDGIGPVLGHGAFGTATVLPDGRVLKLTSDPSETQAGYVLQGKKLQHVVEIFGAWFVRGVRVNATVLLGGYGRANKTRKWPMGISIVERVTPLDRLSTGFEGLTNTVIAYKQEHHLFPSYFVKVGAARARVLLKEGSEGLEEALRSNGKWLRKNDMVDDAYLAEGVADALKETRFYGVYAVDVHGANVGYVEDAKGDRTYKIYDLGSSSAPAAPHAPTVPAPAGKGKKEPNDQTVFPGMEGMLAETQPVPWIGEGRDEMEAPRRGRRSA